VAQLILNRKYNEAVNRAYDIYRRDPTALVMYSSTLFSARFEDERVEDVFFPDIIGGLIKQIDVSYVEEDADALDCISTHLAWWATRCVDQKLGMRYRLHATSAVRKAIELAKPVESGDHTRILALLTFATILFAQGEKQNLHARMNLIYAAKHAHCIRSSDQRARAYRKAGFLLIRWCVNPLWGILFLIRMWFIPNQSPATRRKHLP
jgi:hypothetical protein